MARQHDDATLEGWLTEHGPYDLCMMRYGFQKMQRASDALEYNAHFECFLIKARVLVDFLTGRQKGSDIKAIHYVPDYKAPGRDHIGGVLQKINPHAAHPSPERPVSEKDKINLENCREVGLWVEQAMDAFLKALPSGKQWSSGKARDDLRVQPAAHVKSTFGASSTFTSTSTSHVVGFDVERQPSDQAGGIFVPYKRS